MSSSDTKLSDDTALELAGLILDLEKPIHPEFESPEWFANRVTELAFGNFKYVMETAIKGDCMSVLEAMDRYAYANKYIISIGDEARKLIEGQVEKYKPKVAIEMGAYVGYSALSLARKMKEVVGPEAHVYAFEVWEPFADLCEKMYEFAGMSDTITLIRGAFADKVDELKNYGVDHVDMTLIDHMGKLYLPDLHVLENKGLLKKGSVVLADNVVLNHIDDYTEYVKSSPLYDTYLQDMKVAYRTDIPDGMEISTYVGTEESQAAP